MGELIGLFIGGAIVMIGVAFAFHYFSRRQRVLRELGGLRAVPIAKFVEGGRSKVVGTLGYDGEPLVSPLTGRSCAYYHITVEEYLEDRGHDDDDDGHWYEVIREEKRLHFKIKDATGAAFVNTGMAEVVADVCVELASGTFDDPSPAEQKYLDTHGKDSKDWILNKKLRYREGILEAGEVVSVFGYGMLEADPEAIGSERGYRDLPPQKLVMSGTPEEPLLISDNPATLR